MPWNETDRAKYAVIRERYASDLSDEEFALVQPLLPAPSHADASRPIRERILDALFYVIRAGCPWRYLPKDFPPFTTVQNRFYAWRDSGLWEQIVSVLVMQVREAEGKECSAHRRHRRQPVGQDHRGGRRKVMMRVKRPRDASAMSRSIPWVCRSSAR